MNNHEKAKRALDNFVKSNKKTLPVSKNMVQVFNAWIMGYSGVFLNMFPNGAGQLIKL